MYAMARAGGRLLIPLKAAGTEMGKLKFCRTWSPLCLTITPSSGSITPKPM
jgi:hypothetical protein